MNNEIWLPVPGLDGVEVSSEGNVRGQRGRRGAVGSLYRHVQGYTFVHHDGRTHYLHRLVCLAFHGHPPAGKNLVLHANDDRSDNRAANLRWGNQKENMADAKRNGIRLGRPPRQDITHLLQPGWEG